MKKQTKNRTAHPRIWGQFQMVYEMCNWNTRKSKRENGPEKNI